MFKIDNHKLIIFNLLMLFAVSGFAQGKGQGRNLPPIGAVTGRVLDSVSGQPVEYANITLIRTRDTTAVSGGISNNKGYFEIRDIPLGRYNIRFEFIGYEANVMKDIRLSPRTKTEQHLGDIMLVPATLEGGIVEVNGERPLMIQTIDKRIFNVEKSLTAEGSSAIEVLEQIPSVDVDMDGNISLRGSTNVHVLIDGKPSGLSSEDNSTLLEQIPSSTIATVEVITNPSAKYDPDGMSGIINVVLKKNRLRGLTGSVRAGYADIDRYNLSGQLNYRHKKLNLSAMLAYRDYLMNVDGTNLMSRFDSSGNVHNVLNQTSNGFREFSSYTGSFNAEYALNDLNKLSTGLMLSLRNRGFEENIEYSIGTDKVSLLPAYLRNSESDNNSNSITYSLTWQKDFKRDDQDLKVDFRQTDNISDEIGKHKQDGITDPITYFERQETGRDDNRTTRTFQLDYTHPFGKDKGLELGLKSIQTHMDNLFTSISQDSLDAVWTDDPDLNTHFLYDEGINSAYVTYKQKFGLIGLQGGLRLEQAKTESDIFDGNQFLNEYNSLFPSVHLIYTLAPQKDIQVSYSRRVNRPRVRAVVPITNYYDPLNIRTGNPKLLPEYIDSYELNYSQFNKGISFNGGIYYRQINDLIRRYKEIDIIDGNVVSVTTYRNFSTGRSYGAEMMVNVKPWDPLKIMISGNITRTIIDESGLDADINTNSFGYFLRSTATYSLFPNTDLQFFSMYRSPREIAQGSISGMLFANLALKQSFWEKKGSLSFQVSDLFNSRRFEYNLLTEQFEQTRARIFSNRYIKVNFSYKFGKFVDNQRDRMNAERGMDMDVGID